MKFHGNDIKFACFKAIIIKIIRLLTIILCRQYFDTEKSFPIDYRDTCISTIKDNIDTLPNPNFDELAVGFTKDLLEFFDGLRVF